MEKLRQQVVGLVEHWRPRLGLQDRTSQCFVVGRKFDEAIKELLRPLVDESPDKRPVIQEVYLEARLLDTLAPLLAQLFDSKSQALPIGDIEQVLTLISGLLHRPAIVDSAPDEDEDGVIPASKKKTTAKRVDTYVADKVQSLQRAGKTAFGTSAMMQLLLKLCVQCLESAGGNALRESQLRSFTMVLTILRRLYLIPDVPDGLEHTNGHVWKAMKKSLLVDFLAACLNDDTGNALLQSRQRDIFLVFSAALSTIPLHATLHEHREDEMNLLRQHVVDGERLRSPGRHGGFRGTIAVQLATGQELVVQSTAHLLHGATSAVSDAGKQTLQGQQRWWEFLPSCYKPSMPVKPDVIKGALWWQSQLVALAQADVVATLVRVFLGVSERTADSLSVTTYGVDTLHYEAFLMFANILHNLQYLVSTLRAHV